MKLHLNYWLLTCSLAAMLIGSTLPANAQGNIQVKKPYGYLYCHMSGEGEWTAYALSRDGLNYTDLIEGKPIYDTEKMNEIEGGSRDAYITRAWNGKGFVMTTTDMCVRKSNHWFNYGLNLLKSDDLINWTSVTFDFRKGPAIFSDPESPDVYKDWSKVNRVWAPQVMWDESYVWPNGEKGGYFVYYSLLNTEEDKYDRIFYSYADRTFTRLTKPQVLIDWGYATIDTDINYLKSDGMYHLMIKKEGGKPGIFTSLSKSLTGPWPEPSEKDFVNFEGNKKCEGPSAFQLIGDDTWRVGYIQYSTNPKHYRICKADQFLRNFHDPVDIQGVKAPQHGSFLLISKKEYKRLMKWSEKQTAKQ